MFMDIGSGGGKKNLDETLTGQPMSRRPALEVVDKKSRLLLQAGQLVDRVVFS
jgi:hypothetical protein